MIGSGTLASSSRYSFRVSASEASVRSSQDVGLAVDHAIALLDGRVSDRLGQMAFCPCRADRDGQSTPAARCSRRRQLRRSRRDGRCSHQTWALERHVSRRTALREYARVKTNNRVRRYLPVGVHKTIGPSP